MVGKKYEAQGIAKHGAKMVTAVSCANVPKFTVIVGGSYGAGNYGMCGRAYEPTMMWMWPNSRIGVMGGEQAAGVLTQVREAGAKRSGTPLDEEELAAYHKKMHDKYEHEAHPFFASARLWDDGIIEPTQTRSVLTLALETAANAPVPTHTAAGVFRM